MNNLSVINLAGLFFILGWMLSRHISELEIKELQDICSYYYNKYQEQHYQKRKK